MRHSRCRMRRCAREHSTRRDDHRGDDHRPHDGILHASACLRGRAAATSLWGGAAVTKTEDVAFVAGATGYTGNEVVSALRGRGIRTIAHVRPDSSSLERWRKSFEDIGAE